MGEYTIMSVYEELREDNFLNSKLKKFLIELYKTTTGEKTLDEVLVAFDEYPIEAIPKIKYWKYNGRLFYTTDGLPETKWKSLKKYYKYSLPDMYLVAFGPNDLEEKNGKHFGKGLLTADEVYTRLLKFVHLSKEDMHNTNEPFYKDFYGEKMKNFNDYKGNGYLNFLRDISNEPSTLVYIDIGNSIGNTKEEIRENIRKARQRIIDHYGYVPEHW